MDNNPKSLRKAITEVQSELHKLIRDAPWKQHGAAISPHSAPAQEHDAAEGQPPIAAKLQRSPRERQQRENPWYKSLSWWKTTLEVIAIPCAIGYAFITYFQWRDLRHNFEVDSRAWLKVSIDSRERHTGDPIAVSVVVTNSGKTPAFNARGKYTLTTIRYGDQEPYYDDSGIGGESWIGKEYAENIIIPSTPYTTEAQQLGVRRKGTTDPFSTSIKTHRSGETAEVDIEVMKYSVESITDLANRTTVMVLFGRLSYDDMFGRKHWQTFCFSDPKPLPNQFLGLNGCHDYNGMDR